VTATGKQITEYEIFQGDEAAFRPITCNIEQNEIGLLILHVLLN
jgi:hypothetical protein